MANFGNIISGLLIFMSGVLFAYFTYPYFNSLLTAISDTSGIFEGWETIELIMWIGYFGLLALWILVFPAKLILSDDQGI